MILEVICHKNETGVEGESSSSILEMKNNGKTKKRIEINDRGYEVIGSHIYII